MSVDTTSPSWGLSLKHAFGKLSAWRGVLDVRMFWKKKEKLGDAHVDAIASTAIETVEMEGLLIGLPGSVASEDQVTCLEAYGRGLLDAFTLGVMHGAGMLDLSTYEHINMTQRLKNVHTEVLYAAKSKFVSSPRVAAIFSPIYEKVGLQWDPHKLFVRLDAAVLQKNSFFQIGVDDALFQVEIAKTGYLEPTRNLLKNWFNSNQSCDLVARVGGVTTEKNTSKDIEGDGISLRKAASIIDGRFNFDFSFQNNCMELNFEATTSMPNNFDPCHPKKEEGFLRIEREYEGDYQISFLLAPYDMISGANELEEIENISGYGINALLFSLHAQDSTQEFLLLVEPEEISEEGWYYKFKKAPCRNYAASKPQMVSAQTVVEAIVLCDKASVVLLYVEKTSEYEYKTTNFWGRQAHFTAVNFSKMNKFREVFAKTFGRDMLSNIAEKRGLEI